MKKAANSINNFISYITLIMENCVATISEDYVLITFLIAGFIPNLIIKIHTGMAFLNVRSMIFNFSWYCLMVALGFKFRNNRSRLIYFTLIIFLVYALTYSNLMYYRYYSSFLSLSLITQLSLFNDVKDATQVGMSLFDIVFWCFFIVSLILLLFSSLKNKINYNENTVQLKKENKINFYKLSLISFVAGVLTLTPTNYVQAEKMWNRPIVVENFGLYNYHIIDFFTSLGILFQPEPTPTDYQNFLNYFKEKNQTLETNEYTDIFKGKNVIVIHEESLENFVIHREINSQEITPYFNELADSGMYFSNFYSQQSIGTSADSEFVFNTSLLPINNGTIFLTHYNNTYNATPKLLRDNGYFTVYMHGNNGTFWNRDKMYPTLGYDVFFDKSQYPTTEKDEIGLGISDFNFFDQSLEKLAFINKPYYATLITLSNHTPWLDVDRYVTYDKYGVEEPPIDCGEELAETTVCRYLKSVHYTDWAFGQFIKGLKDRKMLDDTIIVIYGDHPANLPVTEMEKLYGEDLTTLEYKAKQQVPFIIWSSDFTQGQVINKVMGEYDVSPTLQNMLGISNQFALGHDIFSTEDNIVPFVNGDWADGNIYYDSFRNDYYITNPEFTADMVTKEYIDEKSSAASKIIDMSNTINRLDLIGYYDDKNKIIHVRDETKETSK